MGATEATSTEAQILMGEPLRVLIANEDAEHLAVITQVVTGLGNVVVAAGVDAEEIGEATRREMPDVALIGLGDDAAHALELIGKVVHEAACPVVALLHSSDPDFINEAARRGIFAYVTDGDAGSLQSALDIVLRRFAEYHSLEGAFARRATIERANGILMAVHGIDEDEAFDLLRSHSQQTGRKLIDLAEAIINGHRLLALGNQQRPAT
jgi:AmiR/NasT family two-component response regulator